MDLTFALKALIMGLVEGFTEFLPISSTGHLILVGSLLEFTGAKIKVFEVAIQVGALLAVCWEYRKRIVEVSAGLANDVKSQQFTLNVLIGFFPAAILGFFFIRTIQEILFSPAIVASAFIAGGFMILWVERAIKSGSIVTRVETIDDMNALDALKVGLIQAIALIPGTSRSGATIIGGMWLGLSRKASTEFSFFLAMPTLMGAAVYSIYTDWALLSVADLPLFTIGTVAAFVSGFLCVRWLLRYIGNHDYTVFGWYRIAFGLVILITATTGMVDWTH